jgi:AraC-like DNA-binding protein
VANAAYEVGYESASQFSREYSRMFGVAPKRHALGKTAERQHRSKAAIGQGAA